MLKKEDFTKIIRIRGTEYYKSDMVSEVTNIYGYYYACINEYDVYMKSIEETTSGKFMRTILGDVADYGCSCPCNFNCKHLYALLLKIQEIKKMEQEFQSMEKKQLCNILTKLYQSNFHNAIVIKLSCDLHPINIFKKELYYNELEKITKLLDHLLIINPKQVDDIEQNIIDGIYANLVSVCNKMTALLDEEIHMRDELSYNLHIFSKILHLYVLDCQFFDDMLEQLE
uniref:SWIM-type domain-containing protein n=1 Tax=viral metagenome TaxID=1070528 RepID=A0A6C0CAJ6_9ZZZZ